MRLFEMRLQKQWQGWRVKSLTPDRNSRLSKACTAELGVFSSARKGTPQAEFVSFICGGSIAVGGLADACYQTSSTSRVTLVLPKSAFLLSTVITRHVRFTIRLALSVPSTRRRFYLGKT